MTREEFIERLARWIRPYKECIAPWNECDNVTKEHWLDKAREVITFIESLGYHKDMATEAPPSILPGDREAIITAEEGS